MHHSSLLCFETARSELSSSTIRNSQDPNLPTFDIGMLPEARQQPFSDVPHQQVDGRRGHKREAAERSKPFSFSQKVSFIPKFFDKNYQSSPPFSKERNFAKN
jgi:hypothetical protein